MYCEGEAAVGYVAGLVGMNYGTNQLIDSVAASDARLAGVPLDITAIRSVKPRTYLMAPA